MKKPNITEGEWKVEDQVYITSASGKPVAVCINEDEAHGSYLIEQFSNAKAIKAVPKMIDALMGALTFMNHKEIEGSEVSQLQIIKALKEAGVEDL